MSAQLNLKKEIHSAFARSLVGFRVRSVVVILILTLLAALLDAALLGGIRLFSGMVTGESIDLFWGITSTPADFVHWIWIMALVALIKLAVSYLKMVRSGKFFIVFEKYFQQQLLLCYSRLGNRYMRTHTSDEEAFHFTADFRILEKGTEAVFYGMHALIQLALFVPLLVWLSWELTAIILFVAVPFVAFVQGRLSVLNKPIAQLLEYRGVVHRRITQYLTLIQRWTDTKSLRAMNSHLHGMVGEMAHKDTVVIQKKSVIYGGSEFVANVGTVFVFSVVGWFILAGSITPSDVILYLACLFLLYKPVKEFARLVPLYKDAQITWGRVRTLLSQEQEVTPSELSDSHIVMSDVWFSYQTEPLFSGINVTIPLATPVLVSGDNGTGKSTLLKLCSGLEYPVTGVCRLPVPSNMIGYLDQDPMIPFLPLSTYSFELTCQQDRELYAALGIESIVKKLGDRGVRELDGLGFELSGGQRQRLALGIVAFSNAQLLLLDEPTSYLPASERLNLLSVLINFCTAHKKAIIIVSHEPLDRLTDCYRIDLNEKPLL
ncbi:MAG: ABC transporter ATP-binding protein/permease [Fibrobacterales bacterium]